MRPKNLKFCGINCFDTKQEIDFETLASSGIFGIFGPTGSGKTTILDAITLALFGETRRSHGKGDFVNSKSKKASVEFVFDSDGEYLVTREYSIKKSGLVDAEAKLFRDGNLIAEGARAVGEKIYDITGLTCDDFSKCVALPQGEFAAFLKAKPAERTSLVGKLFGLEQYGDELYRKANGKKELLLKELEHIDSQMERLGSNLEEEIKFLQQSIENAKTTIVTKQQELENLREENNKQIQKRQAFEKYQQLTKEKAELDNLEPEIESKRKMLGAMTKVFASEGNIKRYIELSLELKDQEKELDGLKIQFAMLKNQIQDATRRQKENAKKRETIPISENILQNLYKIRHQIESNQKAIAEVETIKGSIATIEKETDEFESKKLELESRLDAILKNISELNEKIEENEKKFSICGKTSEDSLEVKKLAYQTVLQKLQYHFDQIEILNDERMNEIEKRNNLCKKNQEKLHKLLINIDFDDDFEKMEAELESSVDKMTHAKEHIELIESQQEGLRAEIGNLDAEIALAKAEIEKCEQDKEKLETSRATLKEQLKNLDDERDLALLDNAENTVSSETVIGAECPICGNIVTHVYPQKNATLSNINSAIALIKRQIEHLDNEIVQKQIEKSKFVQTIDFYNKQKSEKQKQILQYDSNIQKVLIGFVDLGDNAKEVFLQKLEAAKWKIESFDKIREKIEHIKNHSKILQDQNVIVGNSMVKDQETREVLFDYIQELQKILAEGEIEKLSCGHEQIDEKQNIALELKILREKLKIAEKEQLETTAEHSHVQTMCKQNKIKLEQLLDLLNAKQIEIDTIQKLEQENLLGFRSIEDRIEKTKSAKDAIEKESNDISDEMAALTTKFQEESTRKFKLEQQVDSEKEELSRISVVVDELKNQLNKKTVEDLAQLLKNDTKELQSEVEEFDHKLAVTKKLLAEFEVVPESDFDASIADKILEMQGELAELQTNVGVLTEQEKTKRENKIIYGELCLKKISTKKQYDNFCELSSLLRGKELLAFATEEYLQEITKVATLKLFELLDGRYSLVYKDKDFFVEDHFDDGKMRPTSTLSGGETFVVSLALAIAIAESILRLTNKKIEFFFLDEGFGTLDQELREVIVSSLLKLKNSGIVIGLITHMQELRNDITSRIIVKRTQLQDGTAKSSLVFEQDI